MSQLYTHPRSVKHKVFDAWISPGRFTKNPDIVRLESGRLLLVYSDNDQHWSLETQVLTILKSDDDGATWERFSVVDRADLRKGDERLVTPRLSCLSDGRLVVIIDHDDFGHFHEDQAPGNWLYWSEDGGASWRADKENGIGGFEPDRIVELADGTLCILSHTMRRDTQEFSVIMTVSTDGGHTWAQRGCVAHDGFHRFCEGALVILPDGSLAGLMRENHSAGLPCFVAFSRDGGYNWSEPQRLPFSLHRPYAKVLCDGRVMVTGRNVNGPLGTYAWVGDLRSEAGSWQVGGPRRRHEAFMAGGCLHIENGPDAECLYTLYPPQGTASEIDFEAKVRVEGEDPDAHVAVLSISNIDAGGGDGCILYIAPAGVSAYIDNRYRTCGMDMTVERRISIQSRHGLLTLCVDGKQISQMPVYGRELRPTCFYGGKLQNRTQFGGIGTAGRSHWREIRYDVRNSTQPDIHWHYDAGEGRLPDHFQKTRMIQIHANDMSRDHRCDCGYSSWLTLPDGRILLVDYTNWGDPPGKAHIVGVHIDMRDLEEPT